MVTSQQNLDQIVLHNIRRIRATDGFVGGLFVELDNDASALRRMVLDTHAQADSATNKRVAALLLLLSDEVRRLRNRTFARTTERWGQFLDELAQVEQRFYARLLENEPNALPLSLSSERTLLGQPLKNWQEGLRIKDAERIVESVRQSLQLGITASQAAKALVAKTNLTKTQLHTIVQGSSKAVSSEARDSAVELSDVKEELYVAVLDRKTSALCHSLDGTVHPVGEGPQPPLHHNCRSVRVPLVDGVRPERESYEEWLRRQPKAVQEEILGKAKALLFARGELKLNRFVSVVGEELTLSELAKRDAEAFRKAGLDPEDY